jgi:hypothetical protein
MFANLMLDYVLNTERRLGIKVGKIGCCFESFGGKLRILALIKLHQSCALMDAHTRRI